MFVVGLTGGIGSGKSLVADMFSVLGVPIVDTDILARELVVPGQPALKQIAEQFGPEALLEDGSLNRTYLAEVSFSSSSKRMQLEAILHPLIRQRVAEQLRELESVYAYAVVVVPLLIETRQTDDYNRVLVVDCDEQTQLRRVLQRDDRSEQQIRQIMQAQATREQRLTAANDVISNTGSVEELRRQVVQLDHKYRQLAGV